MELVENTTSIIVEPLYPPLILQSTILLIVSVSSLPVFVLLLYFLLTKPNLYQSLSNHAIILLLISNGLQTLIDVPSQLGYYYTGIMRPATVAYCVYTYFIDYTFFTTCFLLLTWASFERHILIFHKQFFNVRAKRICLHYLPLCFCCVYPVLYYIVFLLLYPCENTYDESTASCSLACYLTHSDVLALYEQIFHGYAQIFLTFVFNVSLFIRVLRQKRRAGHQLSRSKSWKLMIQLLGMCCLLLVTNGGFFLIQLVQLLWDENFGIDASGWIYPISLCMPPAVAFVCLGTLKDVRTYIIRLICRKHQDSVMPLYLTQLQTNRTLTRPL